MSSLIQVASSHFATLPTASPWAAFDKLWTSTMGYSADEFQFAPGKTSMATSTESLAFIACYYAVVLGGREFMKTQPALKLNGLFKVHNFILSTGSAALLVLFLEQIVPSLWKNGLYNCICSTGGWTNKLVTLYYLNYLTKYVELLDTIFLVLKKKQLTFLHCYHHGATALLCYIQLAGDTSIQWVPITLNLTVHVVMYWYYFQSARGIKVAWKKWITVLQITQFIIDLGFIYFALWQWYASTYAPTLPHVGTCDGKEFAAFTGAGILSSYLLLFIFFYLATYKKQPAKTARPIPVSKPSHKFELSNGSKEVLETASSRDGLKWHAQGGLRLRD